MRTKHAVATNSGTSALALALAAVGVQPGDEVLVPALSYVASALSVVHQLAIPVFVDVDPVTFNIDVAACEQRITSRTRAVMPVHLHGLPAAMEEISALAKRHGLAVVEDSAQAQGGLYDGRPTGSLGDVGVFSFNAEKTIPTCGEGGLVTTDDAVAAETVRSMRVLGEDLSQGERVYVSNRLGWNYKPSAIQAAFTRSQLAAFAGHDVQRTANVEALLNRLGRLPGLVVPQAGPRVRHTWHMLRFRFDAAAAGLDGVSNGQFRQAVVRAAKAEGVPFRHYQRIPLPGQPVFQQRIGFGRGEPWASSGSTVDYAMSGFPVTAQVIEDSMVLRRFHLNPGAGELMSAWADAMEKVWGDLDRIHQLARSLPYHPPWHQLTARTETPDL